MNLQSTVNHLEACLAEELAAQTESLTWVNTMEQALKDNDSLTFESTSQRGSELCRKADRAATKRKGLLADLASNWGVAAGTLTLGSVVRRLGGQGARMDTLRKELRAAISGVIKRQRRLSALINMHKRINADVMKVIVGCDSHEEVNQGGSLVNAEA
ncbi:MAG: hypothetical protein ACI9F9_000517 [Candidatus Paceibacteria bacterium]